MSKDETAKDDKSGHDIALTQHKAAEAQPKPKLEEALTGEMTDEAKTRAVVDSKIEAEKAAEMDKKGHSHEGKVKMTKHDQVIHVDPATVTAHKGAGWSEAK